MASGHSTVASAQQSPNKSGSESLSDTSTVCDTDEERAHTKEEQSAKFAKNQKPNHKRMHNFSLGEAPKAKTASRMSSGGVVLIPDGPNVDKQNEISTGDQADGRETTATDKKKTQTVRKTRSTSSLPRNKTYATGN